MKNHLNFDMLARALLVSVLNTFYCKPYIFKCLKKIATIVWQIAEQSKQLQEKIFITKLISNWTRRYHYPSGYGAILFFGLAKPGDPNYNKMCIIKWLQLDFDISVDEIFVYIDFIGFM